MKKIRRLLLIIIVLCTVMMIQLYLKDHNSAHTTQSKVLPLLEEKPEVHKANNDYQDLDYHFDYDFSDNTIDDLLNELKIKYGVFDHQVSYFYQFPYDGTVITHNMEKNFTAASTVKLPVAMLYYDMIEKNELSLDSELLYCAQCYEAGGIIGEQYSINTQVPLKLILQELIINSDNTAMQILINDMGGFYPYREGIMVYSKHQYPDSYIYSNSINGQYAYDTIVYLYHHQKDYPLLIEDLKNASSDRYFKLSEDNYTVAHKYGEYQEAAMILALFTLLNPISLACSPKISIMLKHSSLK